MTQSETETDQGNPPYEVHEVNSAADHVLSALVRVMNGLVNGEVSVCLHCNGMVISGALISGHSYFSELTSQIRGPGGESREVLAEGIEYLGKVYPSTPPRDDEHEGERESQRTTYIHLRDAKLYAPGAGPIAIGLWRGRLSAVAGWNLGALEVE